MNSEERERESLRAIIEDPKQPGTLKSRARRRLQELDNPVLAQNEPPAPPPPAPAPAAAAPATGGVDVTPARSWQPPAVPKKIDISDLLKRHDTREEDEEVEFLRRIFSSTPRKIEQPTDRSDADKSEPAKPKTAGQIAALKKEGHALFLEYKNASDMAWRVIEAALNHSNPLLLTDDRVEEFKRRDVARRIIRWTRRAGPEVYNLPEFQEGMDSFYAYLQEVRRQRMAREADKLMK